MVPDEAVEAAARAMCTNEWPPVCVTHTDDARRAVEAAAPILTAAAVARGRAQAAADIAEQIEADLDRLPDWMRREKAPTASHWAYSEAARIARAYAAGQDTPHA